MPKDELKLCEICNKNQKKASVELRTPATEFADCDDLGDNPAVECCTKCFNIWRSELKSAYDDWKSRKEAAAVRNTVAYDAEPPTPPTPPTEANVDLVCPNCVKTFSRIDSLKRHIAICKAVPPPTPPTPPTKANINFDTLLTLIPFEVRTEFVYWKGRAADKTTDYLSDAAKYSRQLEKLKEAYNKKYEEIKAREGSKASATDSKAVMYYKDGYDNARSAVEKLNDEAQDKQDKLEAEYDARITARNAECETRIAALRAENEARIAALRAECDRRKEKAKQMYERELKAQNERIEMWRKQHEEAVARHTIATAIENTPILVGRRHEINSLQHRIERLRADPDTKFKECVDTVKSIVYSPSDTPEYTKVLKSMLHLIGSGVIACENIATLRNAIDDWYEVFDIDQISVLVSEIIDNRSPITLVGSRAALKDAFDL
jgi:hypothetical protein